MSTARIAVSNDPFVISWHAGYTMRLDRVWLVLPLLLLLQLHLAAAAHSPDRDPDVSTSQTGVWLPPRAGTRRDSAPDPLSDPPPPPPRPGYGTFDCDGVAWADCDDALRPILKAVYGEIGWRACAVACLQLSLMQLGQTH